MTYLASPGAQASTLHIHVYTHVYTHEHGTHTHESLCLSRAWWLASVALALGRVRQENHCEFAVSLGYMVNYRTV